MVVEGQKTEKLYFDDAKVEYNRMQHDRAVAGRAAGKPDVVERSLTVVSAGGGSFAGVLRHGLDQLSVGHERVFVVADADTYVGLSGRSRGDADKVYGEALGKGIEVILSNPCFEVWFRHHFNADRSAWTDGAAAKAALRRLWPEYESKPERHWELLHDRLPEAIRCAERVRGLHGSPPRPVEDCNASTAVDWLLIELFGGD